MKKHREEDDIYQKIRVKGWIDKEDEEKSSNIEYICKKCGTKMKIVDARRECGILMAWCPNLKCRKCVIYKEE